MTTTSRIIRTAAAVALTGMLGAGLAGCASSGPHTDGAKGGLVGIAMPTTVSERWIQDGEALESQLQDAGYRTDLEYAEDDILTQIQQIQKMLDDGAVALVIGAIDGTTLADVLGVAAEKNVPVISYDRLIRNSDAVTYYASFDNYLVGQQQAWSLLNGLGLTELDGTPIADAPRGPFQIELFAGSADDNNATFFYEGAMSVLQPYIDDSHLTVVSGETKFEQVATPRWDRATAQARMAGLLSFFYAGGANHLAGVLAPNDTLARGIIDALHEAGYTSGGDWPVIPGQDAELDSVKAIEAGDQYSTIFKDTRELAEKATEMTVDALSGREPDINNDADYDNGVKVVPAYLLAPVIVTRDTVDQDLVETGYWTRSEIDG